MGPSHRIIVRILSLISHLSAEARMIRLCNRTPLLSLSLLLVLSASSTTSQWQWQNPLQQGNTLFGVCIIDQSNRWVRTEPGTHTVQAGDLASSLYFYRLQGSGGATTKEDGSSQIDILALSHFGRLSCLKRCRTYLDSYPHFGYTNQTTGHTP